MKDKRHIILLSILLVAPFLLSTPTVGASGDKPIIVCTTETLGSLVREYVGDEADVVVLVNPSICPADFDMKPSDMYAVQNAEILFKQNIKGEFWLEGLVEASGNTNLTQVAVTGTYNTPSGARSYIERVGGNLTSIIGVDLSTKEAEMLEAIDEVTDWMAGQAQDHQASSVKVICMNWQKAFVESAGFQVVAAYNPPETLSASDIRSLVETAESEGVALIVDNFQVDVGFGKSIADEAGAEHVVLTNFPGAIPGTDSLAEMFRYNAETLFSSVGAWKHAGALREENKSLEDRVSLYQMTTALAAVLAGVEAVFLYTKRCKA
jgi:ABC-type Zn uptake system ZnuABC Zn-binding protein ZnuA